VFELMFYDKQNNLNREEAHYGKNDTFSSDSQERFVQADRFLKDISFCRRHPGRLGEDEVSVFCPVLLCLMHLHTFS